MFLDAVPQSAIAALRGMAERADHCHLLPEINVPTLLVFGAEDAVTGIETAEKMNRQIKNSLLFTIEKAGHYSNLEQPEEFNRAVVSFIKELNV
jgi:3-oxoadipate enol-lactonase